MAKVDAIHQPRHAINPSTVIDEQVLNRLEMDMDKFEKVSCLFLIIEDYKHGYKALIDHEKNSTTISNFINKNEIADWHDKIMEALCLLQNHEILLNLGISPDDAKVEFATNIPNLTYKINRYAKALYCLFDNLSNDDVSNILARVYQAGVRQPDTRTWPDKKSLEFHMLWWVQEGFINISADKWKLSKVLNVLKALELTRIDAYETLKSYDSEDNEPCRYDDQSNNKWSVKDSDEKYNVTKMPNKLDNYYKIHRGLTIIFNQMKFPKSTNYEYRHGSEVDCQRITKIFKETFEFEVEVHDNSDRKEIYDILDISRRGGEKYDCLVVFILSHGTLGNIIASDGLECPISEIQNKMCTCALDGNPKILVIQACQRRALTTDGPVGSPNKHLNKFRDFITLNSTIPDELSVRDCQKGTWYIQKLCDVLEDMSGQDCCIEECAREVNNRISSLQEEIGGSMIEQVSKSETTLLKKLVLPKRTHRAANASCN